MPNEKATINIFDKSDAAYEVLKQSFCIVRHRLILYCTVITIIP